MGGFYAEFCYEHELTLEELYVKLGFFPSLCYQYDFGDDWCHLMQIEEITEDNPTTPELQAGAKILQGRKL